ncbi:hypothetical protein AB4209_02660 [Vibrio sp. 10N.286.48.C11]|uniref:hypothetical protein n=1 Tax=Vibrio sp. 10N.286.48.C11 TaxID=3229698 RepID=UPI003550C24A
MKKTLNINPESQNIVELQVMVKMQMSEKIEWKKSANRYLNNSSLPSVASSLSARRR